MKEASKKKDSEIEDLNEEEIEVNIEGECICALDEIDDLINEIKKLKKENKKKNMPAQKDSDRLSKDLEEST